MGVGALENAKRERERESHLGSMRMHSSRGKLDTTEERADPGIIGVQKVSTGKDHLLVACLAPCSRYRSRRCRFVSLASPRVPRYKCFIHSTSGNGAEEQKASNQPQNGWRSRLNHRDDFNSPLPPVVNFFSPVHSALLEDFLELFRVFKVITRGPAHI